MLSVLGGFHQNVLKVRENEVNDIFAFDFNETAFVSEPMSV